MITSIRLANSLTQGVMSNSVTEAESNYTSDYIYLLSHQKNTNTDHQL
ncbi:MULTISPECIES: hypothetical protein [unclassified Snodgrassella]|nr:MULTISPECIES: hypothetical protein [unclassified Snodgrassella]MBI0066850.1 hypothetical protein [Snodgrassella sp. M0110]MBI0076231.1 hypothetical protein [Snodgrassella sp. M0118]MBI0078151.1 hypothetical protein [Snodgrassella sp. M0112]